MKCFIHPNADAVGVCVKCGKAVCFSCGYEKPDKHLVCRTCSGKELSLKNVLPKFFHGHLKVIDAGFTVMLFIFAALIDIMAMMHFSVSGINLTDLTVSGIEMLFLFLIGVPPLKFILMGISGLIPILEYIPWCTLAVLDKKVGWKIPGLTFLFNRKEG